MKKMLSVYCLSTAILTLCCLFIIAIDSVGAIMQGQHLLLPELGLANYKVIPNLTTNVSEANKYLEQIYQNGYNPYDFLHIFVSLVPSLSICNMLLFLLPAKCNIRPSKNIMLFSGLCGLASLVLVIALRIHMYGSYGDLEASRIYPFAYIIFSR